MNTWYILKIEKYNIEYYFKGFLLGFTEITPQKKEAKKFDYKEQASLTRYKLSDVLIGGINVSISSIVPFDQRRKTLLFIN